MMLVFGCNESEQYVMKRSDNQLGITTMIHTDTDGDGKLDSYRVLYALSEINVIAYYFIHRNSDYAYQVEFDIDKDGQRDIYLRDSDLDGKLDKMYKTVYFDSLYNERLQRAADSLGQK